MQELNYRNIRNVTSNIWYERALSERLCMALSPIISVWFIKKHVSPNTVTLLMIICGIVAPLLFMMDNIYVQCISSVLFILWFIFDCSDGEVARFTQTFSKHGRDLDYLSHVSCHSLFVMAMWKIYAYQSEYLFELSMFFFALLACELFYRITVLYSVYVEQSNGEFQKTHVLAKNIIINLFYFPNYVVFFPMLYCVSYFMEIDILPFFVLIFGLRILFGIKDYVSMIKRFYKV